MEQQSLSNKSQEEPLYDAAAVQRIVSMAAEIQHKRADLMTGEELERLGADMGLDVQAVRKAIALYEQGKTQPSPGEPGADLESLRQASATYEKMIALYEQEKAEQKKQDRQLRKSRFLAVLLSTITAFWAGEHFGPSHVNILSLWLFLLGSSVSAWMTRSSAWGAIIGLWSTFVFAGTRPFSFWGDAIQVIGPPLMTIWGAISGGVSQWVSSHKSEASRWLESYQKEIKTALERKIHLK